MSRAGQRRGRLGRSESGQPKLLTFTRRNFLRAGLAGAAALAGVTLLRPRAARAAGSATAPDATSAPGVYAFNQDWLFGGQYVSGAEAPGYSESGFTSVTLPHTVTPLSWGDWDATTWEHVWVYRRHIAASSASGQRVFVDFQGVMTNATVFLGDAQIAQHHLASAFGAGGLQDRRWPVWRECSSRRSCRSRRAPARSLCHSCPDRGAGRPSPGSVDGRPQQVDRGWGRRSGSRLRFEFFASASTPQLLPTRRRVWCYRDLEP